MSRQWWFKTLLVLLLVIVSIVFLVPTYVEMVAYPENVDADQSGIMSSSEDRDPPLPSWYEAFQKKMNIKTLALGLDLQGGLLLRYSVDIDSAIDEKLSRMAGDIRSTLAENHGSSIDYELDRVQDLIILRFQSESEAAVVNNDFMINYPVLTVVATSGSNVTLGLRDNYIKDTEESSVKQALEIIRERIDGLGVASPSVRVESGRNIVVELPGLSSKRAEAAERLISTTAVLTFKLIADRAEADNFFISMAEKLPADTKIEHYGGVIQARDSLEEGSGRVLESGKDILKSFVLENESMIPSQREVVYEKLSNRDLLEEGEEVGGVKVANVWRLRLVRTDTESLSGDNVDDAYPASNPDTNIPYVSLKLDKVGGDVFYEITKKHVGDQLAILMDDVLVSDPVIRSEIPGGNVSIEMGGTNRAQILEEVQALVVSLRSGALPAPIKQEFKTLVGPSLGHDSIERGMTALGIGFILVFVFMIIYYKIGGVVASIALSLNLLFILAAMASMGAALTMPGIAGIVLTVGMAVDANVIIFERIREELRSGESTRKSIQHGYEKALWTILDSNITTAIAAVILMQFGSGPVKGFAVTLLIGLISSVFTAFYVTRLVFDRYASKKENIKLPL